MSSIGAFYAPMSSPIIQRNIAALPHYNTNIGMNLPADAAPMGVLANGDIYYNGYEMLTPSDVTFLDAATGRSFDPATVKAELASGTLQSDPLAAAIGDDRASYILGDGGLSGNISESYLDSIASAINNPQGNGAYEGFDISSSELNAAFAVLAQDQPSTVSVSA
jgi:hypothetical protein